MTEKSIEKRRKKIERKIDAKLANKPYPKYAIRYTHNDKNYYVIGRYDFGCYFKAQEKIDASDKGRLVSIKDSNEAINFVLSGIVDEDEGITSYEEGMDPGEDFQTLLKENNLESIERDFTRYAYRLLFQGDDIPTDPLINMDSKTKEICNKALESFTLVTVNKNFPAPTGIVSEEKLTIS